MKPGFEILADDPMIPRAKLILREMIRAKPNDAEITDSYNGRRRTLVLYGAGAPSRHLALQKHLEHGGRVACLDLAYWDRDGAMRVAVDGLHPSVEHLEATRGLMYPPRPMPALREDADPRGPVFVIGMGKKSRLHLQGRPGEWERQALKDARARFPDNRVLYRKKGRRPDVIEWPELACMSIEEALRGAARVICHHSNVAVDACIAGVPVETQAGAALWLYRKTATPDAVQRLDFLSRLAHWQYKTHEASLCWDHVRKVLEL